MIELSLLGTQAICRSDGREFGTLPAQPKRFALLAYLAISDGGLHRRDVIATMFWPDLDQFAARRALRNTLYHLREALGDGVIVTQGDEQVGIDPGMITSDVTKLRAAAIAGRHEEAIDLYHGELLAGIHFPNSGETFEEWLAHERARLLETILACIRALVDRDVSSNNPSGAAYWAGRACALAPGDETWLRRAMTLLYDSGDKSSALRHHESYTRKLSAEFGAKPSAETDGLARQIRDGVGSIPHPRTTQPELSTTHGSADPEIAERAIAPVSPEPQHTPPSTPPQFASRARHSRTKWLAGLLTAAVISIAAVAWAMMQRHAPVPAARTRVLVAVFDNRTGDPAMQSIGRMAEDWLTQGIMRTELVDVVDPRAVMVQGRSGTVDLTTLAKRTGAGMVVSGSYYRSGDSLLFQAALTNAVTGRIVRVVGPIVTTVDKPVAALEDLRSRVMTALASAVDLHVPDDLGNAAKVPSFDAYQAYIEGWDAFSHGDGRHAEDLFVRALHMDTTFAHAAADAAMAAANYHDCTLVDSLQRVFDVPSRGLTRIDRLSLEIANARCRGQNDEMLRLTLERADLEPRTSNLQNSAAAAALWANRPSRALTILQRINPETDLGWSDDTTHFSYWSDLTEAYHLLGRHDDELAAASRASELAPLNRSWMRGRALAALSRPVELLALVDTALTLPPETANVIGLAPYTDGRPQYTATAGWVTVWIARELMVHGDTATARKVAARSYAWYRARPASERGAPEEQLVAAWALELMQAYPQAELITRNLIKLDTANVDYRGELAGLAVERGNVALADSLDQWLARRTDARAGWSADFYRARDAALMHRGDDVVARMREALDNGVWPLWVHIDPAIASLKGRKDLDQLTKPRD